MQQQPVGGGEHDLEKDEEVEQVAGEEAAIEAHEQELEQWQVMDAGLFPARHRIDQRGQAEGGSQQHHDGGQAVHDQDNAEGGDPAAEGVDSDRIRPRQGETAIAAGEEQQGDGELRQQGENGQGQARAMPAVAGEEQQRAGQHGQQDGQDGKVCQQESHGVSFRLFPCRQRGRCRSGHGRQAARRERARVWRSR